VGNFSRCLDRDQGCFPPPRIRLDFENFIRSTPMMDVVMVALAVGFFAVSIAYVYACEQL
jgi:hypothetical protein